MSNLLQVLSIGVLESGKSQRGTEWHRRIFQVYDFGSKVAGNIPVYGEKEKLETYKEGGKYEPVITIRAGDNGRLQPSIVDLIPVKAS